MDRTEYNRLQYLKNRDARLAAQKAYYVANKEARDQYNKEYAEKNRDVIAMQRKSYREKNADVRKVAMKTWYQANVEYAKAKAKTYREINKSKMHEWHREYRKEREKIDPVFKLARRIRTLVYSKIRSRGYTKKSKTHLILGCTYEEFSTYIAEKFIEGMTWGNYGEWHIDHIIPIASAETEDDVIRLNHYTNLQPLWALDNLIKGRRV